MRDTPRTAARFGRSQALRRKCRARNPAGSWTIDPSKQSTAVGRACRETRTVDIMGPDRRAELKGRPPGLAMAPDTYPSRFIASQVSYAPAEWSTSWRASSPRRLRQTIGQTFVIQNQPGAYSTSWRFCTGHGRGQTAPTLMFGNSNSNVIPCRCCTARSSPSTTTATWFRWRASPAIRHSWSPPGGFYTKTLLAEFIAYAKQNPGKLRFSSVGVGNPQFDMEIWRGAYQVIHLPRDDAGRDRAQGADDARGADAFAGGGQDLAGRRNRCGGARSSTR